MTKLKSLTSLKYPTCLGLSEEIRPLMGCIRKMKLANKLKSKLTQSKTYKLHFNNRHIKLTFNKKY